MLSDIYGRGKVGHYLVEPKSTLRRVDPLELIVDRSYPDKNILLI